MSHIAFHTKGREPVKLRGSERAHFSILSVDIAAATLPRGLDMVPNFINLVPLKDRERWAPQLTAERYDSWVPIYLSSHSQTKLQFNGELHHCTETVLNTIIAMESDVMSLMVKIDGKCEVHGWFAPEDHSWFAAVMRRGLDNNLLRGNSGWEAVIELFESDLSEPIVMSYSVTDGFPNPHICDVSEEDEDEWFEHTTEDEKWDMSMLALRRTDWTQISVENLHNERYLDGATLWDAVASPEWKGTA